MSHSLLINFYLNFAGTYIPSQIIFHLHIMAKYRDACFELFITKTGFDSFELSMSKARSAGSMI